MKKVQRFDSVHVKAKIDQHGFLVDRPIVARSGLQVYKTPFGERREFRPPQRFSKLTHWLRFPASRSLSVM